MSVRAKHDAGDELVQVVVILPLRRVLNLDGFILVDDALDGSDEGWCGAAKSFEKSLLLVCADKLMDGDTALRHDQFSLLFNLTLELEH